jgi:hypothetical protein
VGPLPPEELSNWRALFLKQGCTPAHHRAITVSGAYIRSTGFLTGPTSLPPGTRTQLCITVNASVTVCVFMQSTTMVQHGPGVPNLGIANACLPSAPWPALPLGCSYILIKMSSFFARFRQAMSASNRGSEVFPPKSRKSNPSRSRQQRVSNGKEKETEKEGDGRR